MNYDLIIIGSGPGGYVAAIRASQLGLKTAVVERAELGGICLNWGCIPTKALLKSAQVFDYFNHSEEYGISIEGFVNADFTKIVARSREVAAGMSKGIHFLFKKNKIDIITGFGKIKNNSTIIVENNGETAEYSAKHIILATGARAKELPNIKIDNTKIIGYRKALTLEKLPKSMVIIGSGAIGSEFAYFYSTMGTKITLVEFMPTIVPNEDEEVAKQLGRSFKKAKIEVMVATTVKSVDTSGELCKIVVENKKGEEVIEAEIVLSAIGVQANLENIGIETLGIELEKGKIKVDDFYRTNVENIYAIGDIVHGPSLAHVASAEGITCVEKIAGLNPETVDYKNIPGCTYTSPEVASVGLTEQKAIDEGYEIKVGKFPFTASGKASAAGTKDGFVKLIFDAKYGELLGGHLIGANVTEMIAELVAIRKLETTGHDIIKTIHPHPTMSEAIMEAAANAYGEAIHI
jgi:dihydrolipoamide dehydrogenase